MTVALVLLAIICACSIRILVQGLRAVDILFFSIIPIALGFILLANQGEASVQSGLLFVGLWGCFVLGAHLVRPAPIAAAARHLTGAVDAPIFSGGALQVAKRVAAVVAIVSCLGTTYHFLAGGVPLFQSQIEIARFDVTASGLYGVPGRLYLFGVPLSVFLSTAVAKQLGLRWRDGWITSLSIGALVLSRILGGFKSGLIETGTVLLIAAYANGATFRLRQVLGRALPVAVVMTLFVFGVGSLYITYRGSGQTLTSLISARVTTVSAAPAAVVFDGRLLEPLPNSFWNDLRYFTYEYFHIGAPVPFSADQLISASLVGGSPGGTNFQSPVTQGEPAEAYSNLGLALSVPYMLVLGYGFGRFTTNRPRRWLAQGLVGYSAFFVFLVMGRGSLAYYLVNMTLVAVFLLGWRCCPPCLRGAATSNFTLPA